MGDLTIAPALTLTDKEYHDEKCFYSLPENWS